MFIQNLYIKPNYKNLQYITAVFNELWQLPNFQLKTIASLKSWRKTKT